MTDGGRNFFSRQQTDVKVAGTASTEDKRFTTAIPNLIEQSKALDLVRSRLTLADTAFKNRQLVKLTIVFARLLLEEVLSKSFGIEVAGDCEGGRMVRFF